MRTRYDDLISVLRESSRPDRPAPAAIRGYVEMVRHHAYRITDSDVVRLKSAGLTEDEIFEQTVAAAVAAGLERLDAGLGAMR